MSTPADDLQKIVDKDYEYGFVTDIEQEAIPKGLSEDVVRTISAKKDEPEWLLEWRLAAYRHWLTMVEPTWPKVEYPPIDYQDIIYYSAPKKVDDKDKPQSLDEVDPELRKTYEKLGISLDEQERLAGVAVDAVFDSVSVATTFKEKLSEAGIIFCQLLRGGEGAPRARPESTSARSCPTTDNFFATLNSAVFSDGSFVYRAQGRALPDGALHLLPHQRDPNTGQFERTLIVADDRLAT